MRTIENRSSAVFGRTLSAEFGSRSRGWRTEQALASGTPPMMIGVSAAMDALTKRIEKIAKADASVLIQGETGSGKELAARSIHRTSPRKAGPFVAVNCGAVPDSLVETELFGHARGAFTDAKDTRLGVIAQAHGGTLFLDETDTLSAKAQVTLLRFLQDMRYRPVGNASEVAADVRVLAASNQDLHTLVDDGRFRRDLLYRLNIFELWIPPLRDRRDDVEPLANHLIKVFSKKYRLQGRRIHPETIEWLRRQDWPGNVRELENWIHRELLLAEGDEIRGEACTEITDQRAPEMHTPDLRTAKARALAEFEASYLTRTLATARGNVTAAARLAGTERRAFGKLLKKYRIDKSHYHS